MTLSVSDLMTPASVSAWNAQLLAMGSVVGIQATAWQSGGVARSIIAIVANALQAGDQVVSTMNQGGFGSTAAQITIDPSVNPGAGPGWLDFWGQSRAVTRLPPTYASGPVLFTSTNAASQGPYAPLTFHVANSLTGATYSNTSALTIAPNTTTTAIFQADIAGPASSSPPAGINALVNALPGISVTNTVSLVGSNAESNANYLNRCLLQLGMLSPNGPSSAYQFVAQSATQSPFSATLQGGPITKCYTQINTSTGLVQVFIANAGGTPSTADIAAIQAVIFAYCVPNAVTAQIFGAVSYGVGIAVTVFCSSQYLSTVAATCQVAITNYFAGLPLNGVSEPNVSVAGIVATRNVLPSSGIIGACFEAAPYLQAMNITLTPPPGGTLDDSGVAVIIPSGNGYVPSISALAITVN